MRGTSRTARPTWWSLGLGPCGLSRAAALPCERTLSIRANMAAVMPSFETPLERRRREEAEIRQQVAEEFVPRQLHVGDHMDHLGATEVIYGGKTSSQPKDPVLRELNLVKVQRPLPQGGFQEDLGVVHRVHAEDGTVTVQFLSDQHRLRVPTNQANLVQTITPSYPKIRLKPGIGGVNYWASKTPEKRAFTFCDAAGNVAETRSFAELQRLSWAVAQLLFDVSGFGDRILLVYEPGLDFFDAFLGCLASGRVAVVVYPPMPSSGSSLRKFTAVQADCGAQVALTSSRYWWSTAVFFNAEWPSIIWKVTSNLKGPTISAELPKKISAEDLQEETIFGSVVF
eukprot:g21782.t1